MNKIILQPAGDSDATQHYVDTIENPVSIKRISKFVSKEVTKKLEEQHKDGKVPVWGVTPGQKEVNRRKWERVLPGDVALFSRGGQIFASATVAFTTHNKELALELWKTNSEGETWEFIYFLDEVTNQKISYREFNSVAGYKPNNVIQGFNVLDESISQQIITSFQIGSDTYFPPVSQEDYFKSVSIDPEKVMDKQNLVKARTEQAFLRSILFKGKKYSICGICSKEFPVSFLVASHIKKRANCTDNEKRDYKNVVLPMCKFGCDELYEKGYITIVDGKVSKTKFKDYTLVMSNYISKLEGKECSFWTEEREKYFSWHNELYL